ncbi:tyrosine-type recombinase/integrase [Nitrosopumilus sp.]|uniref:tyrosine-type recombinase/integrase n=1 Tax=Nitrosopumilus sp. TaxID=2024843 RepID=UPI00293107F0|nr:tyrosine-type recombinase/integrase [Nitrosopumilus sp.]
MFSVAKYHKKGFYLALISTGCRPGELLQVRKRDADTTQKRIKIRIEAENVKTRSGRSVWLTKEAGPYVMSRIKDLNKDDLIWTTNEYFSYAEKNESNTFNRYTERGGLDGRYKSNGYRKITL